MILTVLLIVTLAICKLVYFGLGAFVGATVAVARPEWFTQIAALF